MRGLHTADLAELDCLHANWEDKFCIALDEIVAAAFKFSPFPSRSRDRNWFGNLTVIIVTIEPEWDPSDRAGRFIC